MSETLAQYQERIRSREREDMRSILKTAYGLRFIWRLLRECGMTADGVFANPFVQGERDATEFNCGVIKTGSNILKYVLEVKPEAFIEMTKKAKETEDERKRIAGNNPDGTEY